MSLSDFYTFSLTAPDGQVLRIVPLTDRLVWQDTYEPDNGIYVREPDLEITLADDPNGAQPFSKIYSWERNRQGICGEFVMGIFPKCAGEGAPGYSFIGDWFYTTPATGAPPASGQAVHSDDNLNQILIHKTDNVGGDRSADLEGITVGTTIGIGGPATEWTVTSITDNGTYVTLGITPGTQFPADEQQLRWFFTIPDSPSAESWEGTFTVQDCTFHVERCQVDIKLNMLGAWRCLVDQWQEEVNMMEPTPGVGAADDGVTKQLLGSCTGNFPNAHVVIASEEDYDTLAKRLDYINNTLSLSSCLAAPETAVPELAQWAWMPNGGNGTSDPHWMLTLAWMTERYIGGTPPADNGNPWIEVTPGIWQRKPIVNCVSEILNGPFLEVPGIDNPEYAIQDRCYISRLTTHYQQITRRLNDFLEINWQRFCPGQILVSNFFGINAGVGNLQPPDNDAYTWAATHATQLGYLSTHDTAYIDPQTGEIFDGTEFTTEMNRPFKDIIDDLRNIYNLKLIYRDDERIWYLEHQSFSQGTQALNLIAPQNEDYLKGQWSYTYDKEEIPIRERFAWAAPTDPQEEDFPGAIRNFDGYPIEYQECITRNSDEVGIAIRHFLTNYDVVRTAYQEAKIDAFTNTPLGSPERATFFTYNTWYQRHLLLILDLSTPSATGSCLSGAEGAYNTSQGWPCLHENLWRWDRELLQGIMNQEFRTFYTSKRRRVQADVSIPMCCEDYWLKFSPWDLVRTQLGWGEVISSRYESPAGRLVLNIRHD